MSSNTQHVATYPTKDQYERWKDRADGLDISCSQFMQDMIEAGMKADRGFETNVNPDESVHQLRRQRNELKEELDRARQRTEELEEQAFYAERREVKQYVEDNPGATTEDIIKHMQETVPTRLIRYLDDIYADVNGDGQHGWYPDESNRGEL